MNKTIQYALCAALACSALAACNEEEVYPTQITRELSMTLDGEPWNIYYGTSNLPLYIYNEDGSFYGNYSTSYRFSLPEGSYRVLATNQSVLMTPPTSLDMQLIEQDSTAKQTFAISDPVSYSAGDPLTLALKTRTGHFRLKANDVKADKSYSILRAFVTTPVKAYSVAQAAPATGEPITLTRIKETSGGGVGYTEDLYLIGSENDKITVRLEYLDADSNIVRTKEFADGFTVLPNQLTEVAFDLNNADEPVIMNYTVTIGQLNWRDNDVFPSVKVEVPDGYTYVEPGQSLGDIFKEQMADPAVDEIRIFLKAGTSYTMPDKAMEGATKPFTIMGQTPGFGQDYATLTVYNISMSGSIDHIRFQNLNLKPQRDRLFNLRNEEFAVGDVTFANVNITGWNGIIWNSSTSKDNIQSIGTVTMTGCRFVNMTTTNALWNLPARRVAPVNNFIFSGNLFHGRNFGTRNCILTGLAKTPGAISVVVENNTFIDGRGTNCTYFDLDGSSASSLTVTVKGNTVSGAVSGMGTWFKFAGNPTVDASGNFRTSGFEMKDYGVPAPTETATTYSELLTQFNL